MKIISFFQEKGGVGKTTHTELFADFLAYKHGAKVAVVDMETTSRITPDRLKDLEDLDKSDSVLARYFEKNGLERKFYDIIPVSCSGEGYTKEVVKDMCDKVWDIINANQYDYLLLDFPGLFVEYSPAYVCCSSGAVDLVVLPTNIMTPVIQCSLDTGATLLAGGCRVAAMWNAVPVEYIKREGLLARGEEIFERNGISFLKHPIKEFLRASGVGGGIVFVRNTVCWPQRYVEMSCPELPLLYEDLKKMLDGE